ncbi:peptidoglycan-recognition protein SB1-like [Zophobas morio]|uniref:peptidoglycan-recognition protein SB1-like n=1 Tax=Zophobas morio TaxID=2755281 RepID=UPI0030827D4F
MLIKILCLAVLPYFVQCACPTIISRSQWGAAAPKRVIRLRQNPPPFVVVHHSDTPVCNSESQCKTRIKNIQSQHMKNNGWDDIGYNFVIGGDGNVYEGRGWGIFGSHVPRYNGKSIGIVLIGNFNTQRPPQTQLDALKNLIACAKENNYVKADYHLIGHRQGKVTECPGDQLFNEISNWPQFDPSVRP